MEAAQRLADQEMARHREFRAQEFAQAAQRRSRTGGTAASRGRGLRSARRPETPTRPRSRRRAARSGSSRCRRPRSVWTARLAVEQNVEAGRRITFGADGARLERAWPFWHNVSSCPSFSDSNRNSDRNSWAHIHRLDHGYPQCLRLQPGSGAPASRPSIPRRPRPPPASRIRPARHLNKHTGHTCFQMVGWPFQRPTAIVLQVRPGQDEAALVAGHHTVEPVGVGQGSDEDEKSGTGHFLFFAGLPVDQLQLLQIVAARGTRHLGAGAALRCSGSPRSAGSGSRTSRLPATARALPTSPCRPAVTGTSRPALPSSRRRRRRPPGPCIRWRRSWPRRSRRPCR